MQRWAPGAARWLVRGQVQQAGEAFAVAKPSLGWLARGFSSSTQERSHSAASRGRQSWLQLAAAAVLIPGVGLAFHNFSTSNAAHREAAEARRRAIAERDDQALPQFDRQTVSRHNGSRESGGRVWVTLGDSVYDVTEFVGLHPGGAGRIMQAAGGPLEPYWEQFPRQHKTTQAAELLEGYKIGRLAGGGEVPRLPDHLAGVNERFFRLRVEGPKQLELSLEDLKHKFPKQTTAANIKCSPAKSSTKPDAGPHAAGGSTGAGSESKDSGSAALWGGARLRDVLQAAGVCEDGAGSQNIQLQLESLDGTPIPPLTLEQALHSGALLAYELDGKPLAPSQGFPLRCVVPGTGGRRNAKWVSKVTVVGREESSGASPGGREPHACDCGSSAP